MNGLDLFSGVGGLSLALKPWVRTVAYCERDRYAQAVLLSRIASSELDRAPIWDDVTSLRGAMLPSIDIIFGGFPCQDISCAGLGRGLEGERSGLFFEIVRLAEETGAPFVFLENVPAIRTRGLRQVIGAFAEMGYDCRWTCVSASSVGAPHKRERWFMLGKRRSFVGNADREWDKPKPRSMGEKVCEREPQAPSRSNDTSKTLADSKSQGLEGQLWLEGSTRNCDGETQTQGREQGSLSLRCGEILAHAESEGLSNRGQVGLSERADQTLTELERCGKSWWTVEPDVGRGFDGVSFGLDRSRVMVDKEGEEIGAGKILRDLQSGPAAQALWTATRGLDCVQAQKVLLAYVRQYEKGSRLPRSFVASETSPKNILRAMWNNRKASCAPLRRGPIEQYFREYPDAMRALSYLVASRGKTPWDSPLWEGAVSRTVNSLPLRVDRIRCLGNAVVPVQAQTAFKILAGLA